MSAAILRPKSDTERIAQRTIGLQVDYWARIDLLAERLGRRSSEVARLLLQHAVDEEIKALFPENAAQEEVKTEE